MDFFFKSRREMSSFSVFGDCSSRFLHRLEHVVYPEERAGLSHVTLSLIENDAIKTLGALGVKEPVVVGFYAGGSHCRVGAPAPVIVYVFILIS